MHEQITAPDSVAFDKAFDRGLRLLAIREHSRQELRRKLTAKEYDRNIVEDVIASLRDKGLQSDTRFVESFTRWRINKGYGPLRIRKELIERGISDRLAESELTRTAEFWLERANAARAKKFLRVDANGERAGVDAGTENEGDCADASRRDEWNRQARFLAQRGFPADLIYRILDGRRM